MKHRILGELKKMALGQPTPYAQVVVEKFPALQETDALQATAASLYKTILHDYGKFSVATIDSFVQQVIRSFAFEIGLDAGFELQLNQDIVKKDLAERLFALMDTNTDLLNWVKRIALDRIEQGKPWDFEEDLLSLAGEIFQERFHRFEQHMREMENPGETFAQLKENLQQTTKTFEAELNRIGKEGAEYLNQAGIPLSDFKGGEKGFIAYFRKLQQRVSEPNPTLREAVNNLPKWTTAKATPDTKERVASVYKRLNDLLNEALNWIEQHQFTYATALAVQSKLNSLSLLRILAEQLSEYRKDNNVLLISDTQQLLRELVKENDAPFIYEKIGNRYQHFLLDEFQDTSRFQWDNFKPLIEESVAVGAFNLVVGDVKQSIYRWRNGDWRLLQYQVKKDIGDELIKEAVLTANYRSRAQVIEFNNQLFANLPTLLQADFSQQLQDVDDASIRTRLQEQRYFSIIEDAYSDAKQDIPPSPPSGGTIEIRFYEKEDSRSPNSWKPAAEKQLCQTIDELLVDKKLRPNQLTILTRNNADARRIISVLLQYKQDPTARAKEYSLLSSDALLISASPAMQLLVAALRYLLNNKDDIARVELVQANAIRLGISVSTQNLYRKDAQHQLNQLPEEFQKQQQQIVQLPLYEAIEKLISLFHLDEWRGEQPYLLAFRDLVNGFSAKAKPSIDEFLRWWQEEGCLKALPLAAAENAIQVMTIHKSKGLAFDVVLVPYADWKLKSDKGILWCDYNNPASALELVPVEIKQSLAKTAFAYDYFEELLMSRMDALNLLYVALTRARQAIYVMAAKPSSSSSAEGKGMSTIADLLYKGLESFNPPGVFDTAKGQYILSGTVDPSPLANTFEHQVELPAETTEVSHLQQLREPAPADWILQHAGAEQQKIGQLTHLVLSRIAQKQDVPICLHRMQLEGLLNSQQMEPVETAVTHALQHPQLRVWFSSGKFKTLNEKAILLPGGGVRRPDKVLIAPDETILLDFKFTQEASAAHAQQLNQYRELLNQMGYPSIKAYIYYGYNQTLVPLTALPRQQGNLFANL